MRIGEDSDIKDCRDMGYLVMDYKVRDFKKDPLNTEVTLSKSLPLYIREGDPIGEQYISWLYFSWLDLIEIVDEHPEVLDFSDITYESLEPTPYNLLSLASEIDSYCGLGFDYFW